MMDEQLATLNPEGPSVRGALAAITHTTRWCYLSTPLDNPLTVLQDKLAPPSWSRQMSPLEGHSAQLGAGSASTDEKEDGAPGSTLDFL
jgi:hypothetical protein